MGRDGGARLDPGPGRSGGFGGRRRRPGIGLLLLAGGLRRRQRLAWLTCVGLLAGSPVLNVTKGLDVEEALVEAFLAGLLVSQAGLFVARQGPLERPAALRPALLVVGRAGPGPGPVSPRPRADRGCGHLGRLPGLLRPAG